MMTHKSCKGNVSLPACRLCRFGKVVNVMQGWSLVSCERYGKSERVYGHR